MEKAQIIKKLEEVVQEVMPDAGELDLNASIVNEYGVNSVSIIKIIVEAEKKFDISFSDYELALSSYDTFADVVATIEEKLA